jgi:hypothetical protein
MLTTTKNIPPRPVNVHRVTEWPNRLGFDCKVNSITFSVYSDRQIGRLAITRSFNGGSTAFYEVCASGGEWSEDLEKVALMAFLLWRDRPHFWTWNE